MATKRARVAFQREAARTSTMGAGENPDVRIRATSRLGPAIRRQPLEPQQCLCLVIGSGAWG
jgi:hypothetical protein